MKCPGLHCDGCSGGGGGGAGVPGMLAGAAILGTLGYVTVEWTLANLAGVLLGLGLAAGIPLALLTWFRARVMPRQAARYAARYRAQGAAVRAEAGRYAIPAPARMVRLGNRAGPRAIEAGPTQAIRIRATERGRVQ